MTITPKIEKIDPAPTSDTFREAMRQLASGVSIIIAGLQASTLRPSRWDA